MQFLVATKSSNPCSKTTVEPQEKFEANDQQISKKCLNINCILSCYVQFHNILLVHLAFCDANQVVCSTVSGKCLAQTCWTRLWRFSIMNKNRPTLGFKNRVQHPQQEFFLFQCDLTMFQEFFGRRHREIWWNQIEQKLLLSSCCEVVSCNVSQASLLQKTNVINKPHIAKKTTFIIWKPTSTNYKKYEHPSWISAFLSSQIRDDQNRCLVRPWKLLAKRPAILSIGTGLQVLEGRRRPPEKKSNLGRLVV